MEFYIFLLLVCAWLLVGIVSYILGCVFIDGSLTGEDILDSFKGPMFLGIVLPFLVMCFIIYKKFSLGERKEKFKNKVLWKAKEK